ncbi:hypothetical protein N489_03145 [Lactococcus lactis subsp. lactis 1AA59]|nr:hypothetical protein N489_03145 [Lactococcus lactis subsp. lactis 1AA59]
MEPYIRKPKTPRILKFLTEFGIFSLSVMIKNELSIKGATKKKMVKNFSLEVKFDKRKINSKLKRKIKMRQTDWKDFKLIFLFFI